MSVAGVKKYAALRGLNPSQRIVAVLSGANMNFERTRFVAERAELGKETEAIVAIKLKDIPGSFFNLYSCISPRSVTGVSYRYRGHRGMGLQSPTSERLGHVTLSFAIKPSSTRHTEIVDVFEKLSSLDMQGLVDSNSVCRHLGLLSCIGSL
jgi:threonine dehydratase